MNQIYTITNPCTNNHNFTRGTIEYVVSEYFWLFRVICPTKQLTQVYVNYVNRLFDNVFQKLNVQIVCYEFPDDITPFSGKMEEFINDTYHLDDSYQSDEIPVAIDQAIEVSSYHHPLLGNIDIMSNCYAVDEVDMIKTGYNVFNSTKIRSEIFLLSKYFTPELQKEIGPFINKFVQYSTKVHTMGMAGCSPYEIDHIIDNKYFPLFQLQNFVLSEMESGKEE